MDMYARYFLVIIVFSIALLCIPYSLLAEAKGCFDLSPIVVFRDRWEVPPFFSESDLVRSLLPIDNPRNTDGPIRLCTYQTWAKEK